jgi:hypothetical protein
MAPGASKVKPSLTVRVPKDGFGKYGSAVQPLICFCFTRARQYQIGLGVCLKNGVTTSGMVS